MKFTLVLFAFHMIAFVKTDALKESEEIPPQYPGGAKAMQKLFLDSMKYPPKAEKEGIGGKVVVYYTIDTIGKVTDIKVVKGIRPDLNQEAIRLISLLKGWTPATIGGIKENYRLAQPFIFKPPKKLIHFEKQAR